jgi:hypothetical protein
MQKTLDGRTVISGILCLIVVLSWGALITAAQDSTPTPVPDSPEVTRLKEQKAQADLRKAIAEAKKAEMDARFPQSETKTLDGKTTVGETRVEEQVTGYMTVGSAANRIAEAIRRSYPDVRMIAIYNDGDIQLLLIYSAATKRIGIYKDRYDKLAIAEQAAIDANPMWDTPNAPCDEKVLASMGGRGGAAFNPLGAVTSVLSSFGDVLALFRTDVDIKGSTFAVTEPVVVTEVFRALRSKYGANIALYYPKEFSPILDTDNSALLDRIEALFDSKSKADVLFNRIQEMIADKKGQKDALLQCIALTRQSKERKRSLDNFRQQLAEATDAEKIKQLKTQIAELQKKLLQETGQADPPLEFFDGILRQHADDVARLDKEMASLEKAGRPLATLNAETELLFKDLIKVDEKTGLSQLASFIRAERIKTLLDHYNGCWLKLSVVIAGGNTKVKTNLITDVFTGGNRISYSGASIVEYHLYDRFGRSLLSDTTNAYLDYRKAKDIRKLVDESRQQIDQQ